MTKYCCDVFETMMKLGRYYWYDDVLAVLCDDCDRHNGMNHFYCFNCGAKIKRPTTTRKRKNEKIFYNPVYENF